MKKTICILAGARPNFVKVSPLVRAIDHHAEAECLLVYAGSPDDPTLEPSLFDDLQMPRPQFFLGVNSTSLNEITSQVMAAFDRFLDEHAVDVVIVVDDLASTMAAAIVTLFQHQYAEGNQPAGHRRTERLSLHGGCAQHGCGYA